MTQALKTYLTDIQTLYATGDARELSYRGGKCIHTFDIVKIKNNKIISVKSCFLFLDLI
jgi:hypothetical protein